MKTTTDPASQSKVHLFLTLAGTAGIVSLFLPFTWDVTPWLALSEDFTWYIAGPAFLSLFITAALVRWRLSGSLAQVVRVILYALSAVSASLTLWVIFGEMGVPPNTLEWLSSIVPVVIMTAGVWLLLSGIRKGQTDTAPMTAAMIAWQANTLMCLISFFPGDEQWLNLGWQSGAWLSLFTAMVYATQIYLFAGRKKAS